MLRVTRYILHMSTTQSTIDFILDQLRDAGNVRVRKMFGEYALYCNEKVVALVCDDTLFVKPTDAGRKFVGKDFKEGVAYPGAKPSLLVSGDKIEDRAWLGELVRITANNVALPKKKK